MTRTAVAGHLGYLTLGMDSRLSVAASQYWPVETPNRPGRGCMDTNALLIGLMIQGGIPCRSRNRSPEKTATYPGLCPVRWNGRCLR
jgi:hypothetical protein